MNTSTLDAMGGEPIISHLSSHYLSYIIAIATILLGYFVSDTGKKYPELNPMKTFEFTNKRRLAEYLTGSKELMTKGRAQFGDQMFSAYTDWGNVLVVPPKFLDALKSDPRLDFQNTASDDTHGYIPGFEPFDGDPHTAKIVTKHLTKALTKLTGPLSIEATIALTRVLTDEKDWHEIIPQHAFMRVVSRMSTRVFMGEESCKDEEWVRASGEYTLKAFQAGDLIRAYPRWARPFMHWFMPSCWEVRRKLDEARQCIKPHLERRNATKTEALARGEVFSFNDSFEWFENEGSTKDPATTQISLSMVAIHTTTDLLQQTVFCIALHPEIFKPLREEVISVLSKEGLKKTALYSLKLMDSVIKEAQRLKPVLLAGYRRLALDDIELPNGDIVKKGTKIICDSTHMWNPSFYKDAETFDPYRFIRMRETPGQDKHAHLVSTSFDHLGFGIGLHSCPGRFFAANEIKIALCHLLLKYDWKLPDGVIPKTTAYGMTFLQDEKVTLLVRRRQEEIVFEDLEC